MSNDVALAATGAGRVRTIGGHDPSRGEVTEREREREKATS